MTTKKQYYSNFLREATKAEFSAFFKDILFREKLSYGCRVYLLSLTTIPVTSEYSDRKHGRKLGVQGKQIAKWRKEARANHTEPHFGE